MELIVAYMSVLFLGKLTYEDYKEKRNTSYLDELDVD